MLNALPPCRYWVLLWRLLCEGNKGTLRRPSSARWSKRLRPLATPIRGSPAENDRPFLSPCLWALICLSLCLFISLFLCLSSLHSICLSIYLSIHSTLWLSILFSIYLSNCLFIYLPILLSIPLSTYPSIYPSTNLSLYIYLSIYLSPLSIHLSIYLPVYLPLYLLINQSILAIHQSICLSIQRGLRLFRRACIPPCTCLRELRQVFPRPRSIT